MRGLKRGITLVGVLLAVLLGVPGGLTSVSGQVVTTTVSDTIYLANGTAASGTVIVSWPAFTTASGASVPNGSTSVTIGTGGALSVALAPNAGAIPIGSYYTVVYHLSDGSVSHEYWVVPVSTSAVTLSAIRSTVLPTSVAMQTVSKSYVDTAIAEAVSGHPLDSSPYVLKAGDTMTGPLVLPADPTASTQAADKHYVDVGVASVAAGLNQKVSLLPSTTQNVVQPTGTQLDVNLLNGAEYASQYLTYPGNNGIANAIASTDCTNGCNVRVEQTNPTGETYIATNFPNETHVEDMRGGQDKDTFYNPLNLQNTNSVTSGINAGRVMDVISTRAVAGTPPSGPIGLPDSTTLVLSNEGVTGGSNLFPQSIEGTVPYFKTTYSALRMVGTSNTPGQHIVMPMNINCYSVGDCLIGSQFLSTEGGYRDEADEGTHPFDLQVREDSRVLEGTCASGCTTGSTSVQLTVTAAPGTEGEGRYLLDTNPAKVLISGTLIGGSETTPHPVANFSGTSFPVSVFFQTTQIASSQSNNVAPGTVTLAIASSGVPSGYATNTAAAPAGSGVACVVDQIPLGSFNPTNYEMANYSVVDGSHIQLTLNKAHQIGATISMGGLCGYGLEQKVDTLSGIRQVFPVVGASSGTSLYYAAAKSPIVGVTGATSAFVNLNLTVASIARSSGVVTVTISGSLPEDVNGLTMNVAGVSDSSYNGSYTVTSTGPSTLTYAEAGANSTSTGGTVSMVTGAYALYPMAEVLGVFDTATKSIDGLMTLAPNNVAWAVSDTVEEPHFYQQKVGGDIEYVGQTMPRPLIYQQAGMQYETNVGPGMGGWVVNNNVPSTNYFGNGGTHSAPDFAYQASGIWKATIDAQAGEQSAINVHCNSHGCGKWNSYYNLFQLDSSVGVDTVQFQPLTSTLTFGLRGAVYSLSPTAFTAGTINATTLNGAMSGANITSGTVNAARLPVFGASGASHAAGIVPDPGATAGTTRYLREDGTFAVPAGGGGGGATGTASITGGTIDGTVIGGTTPAAGSFTSLTASTSVTTPDLYGGSATGSALTVNATSNGSPSSSYLTLQSNGQRTAIGSTNAPLNLVDITQADNTSSGSTAGPISVYALARSQHSTWAYGGFYSTSTFSFLASGTNGYSFDTPVEVNSGAAGAICSSGVFCVNSGNTMYVDASGNTVVNTLKVTQGENVVSYSATPTFSAVYLSNILTLTGNVTSSTLAAGNAGQAITMTVCQNATGSYSFTWPANMRGTMTVGATASKCSSQAFIYSANQAAWLATSVGVANQ